LEAAQLARDRGHAAAEHKSELSQAKSIVYIDSKKSFNPDGNADALRLSKGRSFPLPCQSKPVGKI
jgi:hypothetical protein